MTNQKYQCLICFENCNYPAILDLNCECQYNVHYKCYRKWWKMKKSCIICHERAGVARSYNSFKDKMDYYFLLNLHNKPIKRIQNLNTIEELIPNIKLHAVMAASFLIFDLIFLNINIVLIFTGLILYFFLLLP